MADSLEREWRGERFALRRAERNAFLVIAALLALSLIVNALSVQTEHAWMGHPDAPLAWLLEGSSHLTLLLLAPALIWITRFIPLTAETWRRALPLYLLLSIPYSVLHIAGMALIRWAVFSMAGEDYSFDPAAEALYEYRKDLFSLALFVLIIIGCRELETRRQEAQAAREDARKGQRLTLKCGGRTIWIDAADLISARAAGNYVEVRTSTGQHLARLTLAALQKQLSEAGVNAARVHRSWLVNRDKVRESIPAGSGDLRLRMEDGGEVPASRRFRAVVES